MHQIYNRFTSCFSLLFPLVTRPSSHLITLSARVQHRLRNRQADLLRRLEINHQLELCRLLHRQIGRLGSLQDSVRKLRVPIALPLRISVVEGDVLSFYVTKLAQGQPNCLGTGGLSSWNAVR